MGKKEKSNKEAEKEKIEGIEKVAKKNLESSLWDYVSPKLLTAEQYGKIAEAGQALYLETISKVPDQNIYQQLFLPQLANEGGAITSPYIQNTSLAILRESLEGIKIGDAIKYAGYKGEIKPEYKEIYLRQLDEKGKEIVIGSVFQYKSDDLAKKALDIRQKNIPKSLEEIFSPKEEEKETGKKIAAAILGFIGAFLILFDLNMTGAVIGGDSTITKGIIGVFMIFFALLIYLKPLKKALKSKISL
jgi:hypothetical protein